MGLLHSARLGLGLRKATVCVLVLGLQGAGKTTVTERLATRRKARRAGPLSARRAESGVFAHVLRVPRCAGGAPGGKVTALDSGAAASLFPYYPYAQAVLFVLDATVTLQRVQEAQDELDRALSHAGLAHVPVLFLLNKTDLPTAQPLTLLREALDLGCASGGRRFWALRACSAATGEGLEDVAEWLLCNAAAGSGGAGGPERCATAALQSVAAAGR